MGLPKAIQAQIEQADAIVEQLNQGMTPEAPEAADTSVQEQVVEQVHNEPQVPVETVVPQPPVQTDSNVWERKFHSLQGKYDAEVPRMAQQLREMGESIQALIAENATLKAQKPSAPELDPEVPLITDSDREAFGNDLISLADRIAKQNLAQYEAERKQMAQKIKELEQRVGNVDQQVTLSAKDKFFVDLGAKVADWEAINVDQAFLGWLNEVDPVYGVARQAALEDAYSKLDAVRVSNIFNMFKQATGRDKPQVKPQQSLQSQVAPTRSRSNPAPATPANAKIWTQKEIEAFYTDKRRGYMDDADAARIEIEIEQAVAEGRVSL